MLQFRGKSYGCAIELAAQMLAGKWKGCIMCHLMNRNKRYAELHNEIPDVSQKVLTQQRRAMEKDGLLTRTIIYKQPMEVTYSLTQRGRATLSVLMSICLWVQESMPVKGAEYCCCTSAPIPGGTVRPVQKQITKFSAHQDGKGWSLSRDPSLYPKAGLR
jgi:DNA-binding HxlR family transcriptional regulator